MSHFSPNKLIAKVAGVIAGVPSQDVQSLMEGDPRDAEEQARKLLGLDQQGVAIAKSMRRLTPLTWSLQYLDIPRKVYEKYLEDLHRQTTSDEEYPAIQLQSNSKRITSNLPKIDGYLNFYKYLIELSQPHFQHTQKWRYIPPKLHLTAARNILDKALNINQITMLEIFRVSMFMYYGMFNAVMGVKVDKVLDTAA